MSRDGSIVVVLSPLIALMKDQVCIRTLAEIITLHVTCTSFFFTQVAALNAKGVPAAYLSSDTKDRGQQERILRGQVKILYIGPELLMLPQWREINAEDTSLQRKSGSLCNRRGLLHRLVNRIVLQSALVISFMFVP